MTAMQVSQMLARAGIVDSAESFNRYLIDHGLTDYINIGRFTLSNDMEWSEIASVLTGR